MSSSTSLLSLPLHFQPGSAWEYSLGLDVLGLAIEAVVGKPLREYLSERLFSPLGMRDTGFVVPSSRHWTLCASARNDPLTREPQTLRDGTRLYKFDCGGGCAVSTAVDYLRFAQMLLNGGELDGVRILGRKTVEYMTADHMGAGDRRDAPARLSEHQRLWFRAGCRRAARRRCLGRQQLARRIPLGGIDRHVFLVRPGRGPRRRLHGACARRHPLLPPATGARAGQPGAGVRSIAAKTWVVSRRKKLSDNGDRDTVSTMTRRALVWRGSFSSPGELAGGTNQS